MPNSDKIEFSFLDAYPSLEQALIQTFGISKNRIKQFINNKNYLKKAVKPKDHINLSIDLINNGKINPIYDGPQEIKIIFEDKNFLVISKPTFCHSHPLSYSDSCNVLSFISANGYDHLLKVNNPDYSRGLLFRLDFQTSGVLVYVKDEQTYKILRTQFHQLIKKKTYFAIVQGRVTQAGTFSHHLVPSGLRGNKMKVIPLAQKDSFRANLEIKKIIYNEKEDVSLVQVILMEGIRHQIRCQLSQIGHPILGDELYGGRAFNRLFLHAYKYEVVLDSKTYDFRDENLVMFETFFDLNSLF